MLRFRSGHYLEKDHPEIESKMKIAEKLISQFENVASKITKLMAETSVNRNLKSFSDLLSTASRYNDLFQISEDTMFDVLEYKDKEFHSFKEKVDYIFEIFNSRTEL